MNRVRPVHHPPLTLTVSVLLLLCFVSRAIHDVKATDLGLSKVRFKAEVDFDGRVVTRSYLEKQDIDQILNVRKKTNKPSERKYFSI